MTKRCLWQLRKPQGLRSICTLSLHNPLFFSVEFDYEEQQQYTSLYVTARDDGPGLSLNSAPADVVVNIVNLNDNPPAFGQVIWGKWKAW